MKNKIIGILVCILLIATVVPAVESLKKSAINSTIPSVTHTETRGYWVEAQKLLELDGMAGDWFGESVALAGDTALIGVPGDDDFRGSAYVFTRTGTTWTQQAKLIASDGAAGDWFGVYVALAGDTALVGTSGDDGRGSAYVFTRTGTTWIQQAKLLASDGAAGDEFGWSVSLSGGTALIGADGNDDNGESSGSAYVFIRTGTTWTQQAKLLASDGAAADRFGFSVAVAGDTALIGAPNDDYVKGSTYVFTRTGTTWTQQAKLLASDGTAGDGLGNSVSLNENTALIGAAYDDDNGALSGSAYVFTRGGSTWTQQQKLHASDGATNDLFGCFVSLSGDTTLIGAIGDDDNGDVSGSAYVFTRTGTTWTQQAKLLASDGVIGDSFGMSVAVAGDTAFIGAYGDDDNGDDSGSAYVFTKEGGNQGDLTITEVTPIQTIWNPHAFIVSKKTALRVTVISTFDHDVTATFKVTYNFGGSIYYDRNEGGTIHYSKIKLNGETSVFLPGGPAETESEPWNSASLFWTHEGTDNQIKVEVDPSPYSQVPETDETNNVKIANPITFYNSKDFSIAFVKIKPYQGAPWTAPSEQDFQDTIFYSYHFIEETYPIRFGGVSAWSAEKEGVSIGGWWWDLWWLDRAHEPDGSKKDRYVGVCSDSYFQENGLYDQNGLYGGMTHTWVTSSIVRVPEWFAAAHEIHHNLPPDDDWPSSQGYKEEYLVPGNDNGFPAPGYRNWYNWGDSLLYEDPQAAPKKGGIIPEYQYGTCYMGSVPSGTPGLVLPDKYTCPDCYNHLIDKSGLVPDYPNKIIDGKNKNKTLIFVSGIVDKNHTLVAKDIFVVKNKDENFPTATQGNYSIELIDNVDQVITEYYFDLPFQVFFISNDGTNGSKDTDFDIFSFRLPYPTGLKDELKKIQIKYQDEILAQQTVSDHNPVVHLINPHQGEQIPIGENYNISWEANDPDGDTLEYAVLLSYDDGKNWDTIDMGINNTYYCLNTSTFFPSDQCRIRIFVNDGFNTATNDSEIFSFVQSTIFANVNGPYAGMVFTPIQFNGSVSGGTPPYTLNWEFGDGSDSNQQNPIHTYFIEGIYNVTLTVIDCLGYCDKISTMVYVMNESSFHKTLLVGLINGTADKAEFTLFNSKLLLSIDLSSFTPTIYKSNELIFITKKYIGIIRPRFIIGIFNTTVFGNQ